MKTEVEERISPGEQALMDRDWKVTKQLWRSLVDTRKFAMIRLMPTGKAPVEYRWRNKARLRSFEQIGFQSSMNAGIVTGSASGIIVLDVDDPVRFEALGLEVPDTFTVKTGKGYHYYFKMPLIDRELYRNRAKGSYDIRASMGYVVAPGSVHPSGVMYEIVNDRDTSDAPDWLLSESKMSNSVASEVRKKRELRESDSTEEDELVEVDLASLRIPAWARHAISSGYPEETKDRSKVDYGVICALLKAGCSDAQIRWIFTEYPIGEKSDEHPDKYGYLTTTIDNAFEQVVDEIETQDAVLTDLHWSTIRLPDENDLDAAYKTLIEYASRDLRSILEKHGNIVTAQRHADLRKLMLTFSAMANRKLQGRIAIPLPTGYGKTTSIIAFLSRAADMGMLGFREKDTEFSIAITAFKVDELCALYKALVASGVPEDLMCLCHSYKYNEAYLAPDGSVLKDGYAPLPATHKIDPETGEIELDSNRKPVIDTRRPILLLTHNKTKSSKGLEFDELIAGRTMLIWDEAMLSTEAGIVSVPKIETAINHLKSTARSIRYSMRETATLQDLVEAGPILKTAEYLQKCHDSVWEEIGRQINGEAKRVLEFDYESLIAHEEMLEIVSDLIKYEQEDYLAECLSELKTFIRITQYSTAVELSKADDNHMIVRFDIVMPDSVENIVVLDASSWINVLMKLDASISIPEGIEPSLSYEGTVIHRIDFNSGREEVLKELQAHEKGLLDVIDEIVSKHPEEAILFFTHKEHDGVNAHALIEEHLQRNGHDIHAPHGHQMRFNWMTHGNYTASNKYSHCTVMIFVGMLHKPQYVYRAQAIAQTRDLTTTITKVDEARIKEAGHATDAHQGINRGAGRVIRGNTTQPVNAYYTYLNDSLVEDLKTVMPKVEHRLYETDKLKPRTQLEACVKATKRYLSSLVDQTTAISKAIVNRQIPEMSSANKRMRDRVSVVIDSDVTFPWKTEGRSWVLSA